MIIEWCVETRWIMAGIVRVANLGGVQIWKGRRPKHQYLPKVDMCPSSIGGLGPKHLIDVLHFLSLFP